MIAFLIAALAFVLIVQAIAILCILLMRRDSLEIHRQDYQCGMRDALNHLERVDEWREQDIKQRMERHEQTESRSADQ